MKENLIWASNITDYLEKNDMLSFYMKINHYLYIKNCFKHSLIIFTKNHMKWEKQVKGNAIFKKEIGFEKYLSNIGNLIKRAILTNFRLSNHKLMIEAGWCKKHAKGFVRFLRYTLYSQDGNALFIFLHSIST